MEWGSGGFSVLVKDPSTAYRYHPKQGAGQGQAGELQVCGLGNHGTDVLCLPAKYHVGMDGKLIGDQCGQRPSGPLSDSFSKVHSGTFSRTWGGEEHNQWMRLNFIPTRWLEAQRRIKFLRITIRLTTMVPFMEVLAWEKKNCSQTTRTKHDFYVHLVQTLHF